MTTKTESNQTFDFANLTKDEMSNVIAILLDMDGMEGQLKKLSIPALKKMYDTLNKNAMAFNLAKQEARYAQEREATAERRAASFEREVKQLKGRK